MSHQYKKDKETKGAIVMVDDRRIELSEISSLSDAKSISIGNLDSESIDLSQIITPTLEKLVIFKTSLTHVDLHPLSTCKELLTLKIAGIECLTNLDLRPLSSCKKLSMLDVSMNSLRDIDLRPLSSCKKLSMLDVSMNSLRDIDLSVFQGHSGLAVLNVTMNDIEKMNLQALRECSNLQVLWLGYNPLDLRETPDGRGCVSGIDFTGFDRLQKLRVITINGVAHFFNTSITTDFVLNITDLIGCPSLETFDYDYEDVTLLAHLPKYDTRLPSVFKKLEEFIVWPGYR